MVDLGYSFRSPKYELTISDGDPVHGPGLYVFLFLYPRSCAEYPRSCAEHPFCLKFFCRYDPAAGALFSPNKLHVISEKMRLYLWIQPREVPGPLPGGSSALKCRACAQNQASWNSVLLSSGSSGSSRSSGSTGNDVRPSRSDPQNHTRRGPG